MRRLLFVIVCALALAGPAGVRAHSLPYGVALVWADVASSALPLIVSNRGLVFADGTSASLGFSLRCNEGYGANTSDRPLAYLDASGALVIGTYNRVQRTRDRACSLSAASGLPDLPITSLLSPASAPERMYVATRTIEEQAAVFASVDRGLSFSEVAKNKPDEYYEAMVVAPSDPLRLYALRVRIEVAAAQVSYAMAVSSDGGKNWQDHALPGKTFPLAVHPTQPDVLFAYQPTDRLETNFDVKRSSDRGQNFQTVLPNALKPTAFAGSAQPGTLFLGVQGPGGLYRSRDDGLSFEPILADQVQRVTCLAEHGQKLWLCANLAPNLDAIWTLKDDASGFDKVMSFDAVHAPVACSGAAQEQCAMPWHDFAIEVLPTSADAGASDAGPAADAGAEDAGAAAGDPGEEADAADEMQEDAGALGGSEPADADDDEADPGCQLGARGGALGGAGWLALALALRLWRRRGR